MQNNKDCLMQHIKDYTGSVYGGLSHLLMAFCQARQLAAPAGLEQIQNLERFDFSIWRDILTDLNEQTQSPALGLEIAEYVEPKHLGIIAYMALSCDTLSEALSRYRDFHRLIYDGSPLQVEMEQDCFSIHWEKLPQHLTTQITDEIAIALLAQFLRQYLSLSALFFKEVHFIQPAPANLAFYERFFSCKVKFSQSHAKIIFHQDILTAQMLHPDQTLQNLLMQQARALLEKLPNTTQLDERLQQMILKGLQTNRYQIEEIADQLKLSVRQLQRHLQQQGSTFQQRVQDVRHLLAIQYLQDPHLSIQDIALLLSYSEQSAFQRAFKLWTGITPLQWKQQNSSR